MSVADDVELVIVAADRMEARHRVRAEYPMGDHLDPITLERLKALGKATI